MPIREIRGEGDAELKGRLSNVVIRGGKTDEQRLAEMKTELANPPLHYRLTARGKKLLRGSGDAREPEAT